MLALRHLPNDETGMYSLLLSPGINADPNLRVGRQTAIHFACEWLYRIDESSFDPVIVRLILEHPAYDPESINSPGARGLTPWQLADGHKEVLDLLKQHGATEPRGDDWQQPETPEDEEQVKGAIVGDYHYNNEL